MEFNEKLQELRKQKGLTQEELASSLFVSRTAISKWESGRGYPSIESLKLIAKFFSVTIDELLSTDEILTLAEQDNKQKENCFINLIYGLLDVCFLMLVFLPFFASKVGTAIQATSLLKLDGTQNYLKILYFILIIGTTLVGILTLSLQGFCIPIWQKIKVKISLSFGIVSVLLFIISLQPYAAVFSFLLLAIKVLILKKQ